MIQLPWGMHSSLAAAAWHLKYSDKNYWARVSLNKLIKIYGCRISNRSSAALVKHLDDGSFAFDEFSNSSFLLAVQLLQPSRNFLHWRSARRSFSLLFAKRPLEVRTLKRCGGVSSSLGLQIWESPFGDFCSFSVAFTTPRTAKYINGRRQFLSSVPLDRWLLELDKLFRTAGNEFFKPSSGLRRIFSLLTDR